MLFKVPNKIITIGSLHIPSSYLFILAVCILFVSIFTIIYFAVKNYYIDSMLKKHKLTQKKQQNFWAKINDMLGDRKSIIEEKIIFGGNAFGISDIQTYLAFKISFTLGAFILSIQLHGKNFIQNLFLTVILTIIGFYIPEFMLSYGRRKRRKEIRDQIPLFLVTVDSFFKAGFTFQDILWSMQSMFYGQMAKEVSRLYTRYTMSNNFEESVREFCERLDIPEKNDIELKLRQVFYTGVFDDLLTNEQELIEKKVVNDLRKETEMFDLYISLCLGLLLLNIFIIVVLPLMSALSKSFSGLFK